MSDSRAPNAADVLVACLANEGVEYIFGVPGEENLDALRRQDKVKLIVTRHEQAAGFMASTVGRLTGHAGVCLSTLGPGATNFATSAAYAHLAGLPSVIITGQKPIKKSKQGRFQIVDTVGLFAHITKRSVEIVSANLVPPQIRESFRVAEEEKPGPVHIELPEDVAGEISNDELGKTPFHKSQQRRPIAEEKAINMALQLIKEAKRPLLLVGAGANRKQTCNMLTEFIAKTGMYWFNTQMGKGVIDENLPQYLGCAALSQDDYIHCGIERADLIINVGHDVVEKPPFFMHQGGTKVIHINYYSAQVDEVYFPQVEVVGDIANAIWQIKEALVPSECAWDFSYFEKIAALVREDTSRFDNDDRFPMCIQRVIADTRGVMPEDGIVCLDNGLYKVFFARSYNARDRNTLLLDNALATMGAGFPSAMAAKMVYPNRKVIAVCGDGGFMMNSQELETAVRLKLDLVIVVVSDNCYGMIAFKQETLGYDVFGMNFGNPDFVKYAEAYGAKGHRVTAVPEFSRLLRASLDEGGVHLIEVPIDYRNCVEFMDEIKTKVCEL